MEKQIKEFLSLIFIGNMNVNINDNNHLITIGGIYTPFKTETRTNDDYEIIEERTIRLHNDTIEISYSYVSGIDFNRLTEDINVSHMKVSELFSPYYFMIEAPASELINEDEYWEHHAKLSRLRTLEDKYSQLPTQYGLIGTLVSNDLALVYRDKTITGGICLPNGETAFISAKIDEFGNIGILDIVVYDSLVNEEFDLGLIIDYNDINQTVELLKEYNIYPVSSPQIDFNQILIENHCSDLKNYMWQIYRCKDTIVGKIQEAMQSEKLKVK